MNEDNKLDLYKKPPVFSQNRLDGIENIDQLQSQTSSYKMTGKYEIEIDTQDQNDN